MSNDKRKPEPGPKGGGLPFVVLAGFVLIVLVVWFAEQGKAGRFFFAGTDFPYRPLLLFVFVVQIAAILLLAHREPLPWDRRDWILAGVLGATVVAVLAFTWQKTLDPNGDNARYILIAREIARGHGFRQGGIPGAPFEIAESPGLPFLLVPFALLFGTGVTAMRLAGPLYTLGLGVVLFFLFARWVGRRTSLVLAVLSTTAPYVVRQAPQVMTESPYLLASALALYFVTRYEEEDRRRFLVPTGVALVFTYWLRVVGLAAVVAAPIYLAVRRKWKKAGLLLAVMAVVVLPWEIRCAVRQKEEGARGRSKIGMIFSGEAFRYAEEARDVPSAPVERKPGLVRRALSNMGGGMAFLFHAVPNGLYHHSAPLGGAFQKRGFLNFLLWLLLVGGGVLAWRQDRSVLAFYYLLFLLGLAPVTSFREDATLRYVLVITPFSYFLLAKAFRYAGEKLKEHVGESAFPFYGAAALLLVTSFSGNAAIASRERAPNFFADFYGDYLKAAEWVKANTPPGTVCAARKDGIYALAADRPTVQYYGWIVVGSKEFNDPGLPDRVLSLYHDYNVRYVVVESAAFQPQGYTLIHPLLLRRPDIFREVWNTCAHPYARLGNLPPWALFTRVYEATFPPEEFRGHNTQFPTREPKGKDGPN